MNVRLQNVGGKVLVVFLYIYIYNKFPILDSVNGLGFFKGPVGRCKATTPSSLELTSNKVITNY